MDANTHWWEECVLTLIQEPATQQEVFSHTSFDILGMVMLGIGIWLIVKAKSKLFGT
mgnify:CR=1 FL=1